MESRGIPTICLSCAHSITRSVHPPRAVFLDFPLGRTAGKPGDKVQQRHIMLAALDALATIQTPGEIRPLPYRWSDDDNWKRQAMRRQRAGGQAADDRNERKAAPQYQTDQDATAAAACQDEGNCPGCVFLPEPA